MYKTCKNCKKLYWRDVKNCLACRSVSKSPKLELTTPKKFTVIDFTTVNIPSKEHRKVPYNILLLKDEFGHTSIKKTFNKYKIGTIIKNRKINTSDYVTCSKVRYIDQASIINIFNYIKKVLQTKSVQIDLDLPNCKPKTAFEAGKMLSQKTLTAILDYLKSNNIKYSFINNAYKDIIKLKYQSLPEFVKSNQKQLVLKLCTIDNIVNQKQEKNTIYFIDANFYTYKNRLKKTKLIFLTNNLKLFTNFFKNGEIDDKLFYGEEAEIIYEEILVNLNL